MSRRRFGFILRRLVFVLRHAAARGLLMALLPPRRRHQMQ
jgi:hypothetical protein